MGTQMTLFDVAQRGMSAQLVRMNAAASNLANAGTVSSSEAGTYRPIRPVFAEELDRSTGLATVNVRAVVRENAPPGALTELVGQTALAQDLLEPDGQGSGIVWVEEQSSVAVGEHRAVGDDVRGDAR